MPASLKLDGLKEINRKLEALGSKVANRVSKDSLREASKVIRKEMRSSAPKGKTGNLRKAIKYKVRGRKGNFTARIGVTRNIYYAYFIEYGTKAHRVPTPLVGARNKTKNKSKIVINGKVYSGANHPGIKANPFLRRSWESSKKRSFSVIKKTLWKRMLQEANRR